MTPSRQKILILFLVCVSIIIPVSSCEALQFNNVSQIPFHIDKEWAVVWINEDASIDLLYNITITYGELGGEGYIYIGLPAGGFDIVSVNDLEGASLTYKDTSAGSDYVVEVFFGHPMDPGESDTVILVATVPNMVFEDDMNPGNVGMQFIPTFFETAEVLNLRVAIVPPSGVTKDEVKTTSDAFFTTIDGEFAVFWEQSNLPPNTRLTFGVSFPEEYVTIPGPDLWLYLTIIVVILGVIGIFVLLLRRRKETYEKPRVMIEALGPRRGLTAVEAAVVVDTNPAKVLSMILFGLLIKGLVTVAEVEPIIKVSKVEPVESETRRRYYEIDFLKVIEPNGSLDERRLARTYLSLRDNVDKKMRGYSRVDTVNYYRSIVDKAWQQVTQASTPQLKEDVIEQNLQWLLVDEKYQDRFREAFPPNIVILPRPHWYWYWHGPSAPRPRPSTTTTPGGTPSGDVTPIPAQEFADNVVSGLEKATSNLVKDVENFTKRLIPSPRTAQSRSSVRSRSRCVCACAACACACACVSCACACAGGGAR